MMLVVKPSPPKRVKISRRDATRTRTGILESLPPRSRPGGSNRRRGGSPTGQFWLQPVNGEVEEKRLGARTRPHYRPMPDRPAHASLSVGQMALYSFALRRID